MVSSGIHKDSNCCSYKIGKQYIIISINFRCFYCKSECEIFSLKSVTSIACVGKEKVGRCSPSYGSKWIALEWRRPQRGNGFAIFAKVCILLYSYLSFDNCYLCSGWFKNLGNFQIKSAHHQCLSFIFRPTAKYHQNIAPRSGVLGNVLS